MTRFSIHLRIVYVHLILRNLYKQVSVVAIKSFPSSTFFFLSFNKKIKRSLSCSRETAKRKFVYTEDVGRDVALTRTDAGDSFRSITVKHKTSIQFELFLHFMFFRTWFCLVTDWSFMFQLHRSFSFSPVCRTEMLLRHSFSGTQNAVYDFCHWCLCVCLRFSSGWRFVRFIWNSL